MRSAAIHENIATAIFQMFQLLTASEFFQNLLSVTAVLAIATFFLTSSDSGSLVVSSMASGGLQHPPKHQRIFWAVIQGCIAVAVLLIGGEQSFNTIQAAVIMLGLPFSVALLALLYSLYLGVASDDGSVVVRVEEQVSEEEQVDEEEEVEALEMEKA